MDFCKRAWAEIRLDRIRSNYDIIRSHVKKGCKIISIVKADAYGHGAIPVARCLDQAGTDMFAVSNIEEALQLRNAGISKPVLILGYTPPENAQDLAKNDITQAVFCTEYAQKLSAYAAAANVTVNAHIKLDTGMHRIGFGCSQDDDSTVEEVVSVCKFKGINPTGVFTHFAASDMDGDEDGEYTRAQFAKFTKVISLCEERGVHFQIRHCCNSAAIFTHPEMQLDAVRPGIILYGLTPSDRVKIDGLTPAMELKTVISMVKTVKKGMSVSYGRTATADRDMTIATVPIGYADGYPRLMSNSGHMLVHGMPAPVFGRVCMDQSLIDVSDIGQVAEGDVVTVFGRDNGRFLPVEEVSSAAKTINYETVCLVGKRVTRIYYDNDNIIGSKGLL